MNQRSRNSLLRCSVLFLLCGALAGLTGYAVQAVEPPLDDHWDIISISGARVGCLHEITRKVAEPEPEIVSRSSANGT